MTDYVIGDLHGCYDPFRKLLDKISFDPTKDKLWLTGDIINRGPKSRRTLQFVKSIDSSVISVLGNHDLHLLALSKNIIQTKDLIDTSLAKILHNRNSDELIEWLRQRPLAHYSKKLNTIMVHAGIPPQWTINNTIKYASEVQTILRGTNCSKLLSKMYGNKPDLWSPELTSYQRYKFTINALTRMRLIDNEGRLNFNHNGPPPNKEKRIFPWFEANRPKWEGTRIIFGHWSALKLIVNEKIIAVDTGCVWGNQLTAVKLSKKLNIVSVNC